MKRLLLFLCVVGSLSANSQSVEKVINLPTTSGASPTRPSLIYYPDDYNSSSTKYPLLVFLHGVGEGGTNLSSIYNSSNAGGPAYFIEHSGWPSSFTNPADGKAYKFIVVSPQANNGWSSSGDETECMIKYLVANYRVDVNRIYLTGLSAGGAGVIEYAAHLNPAESSMTSTRTYEAAAIVPMSMATIQPPATWSNKVVTDGIKSWGHGDPNNDVYGEFTMDLENNANVAKSGFGLFTPNNYGHSGWNNIYIPTFKQTINGKSMNIYEWMLSNSRGTSQSVPVVAPPTVSAGSSQTITLPTSSVTLTGTATAASGHSITKYAWTKVSGPSGGTIASAAAASTKITALVAGTYDFKLTVTQDDGQTAAADATVTVNSTASSGGGSTSSSKTIPGKIEAESYDNMSGVQTESTLDLGGGLNVGYIDNGDWMDYNVSVSTAGSYTASFRVAAVNSGAQFQLRSSSGTVLATLTVPVTGNYQGWTTVTATVTLPAGSQTLRVISTKATNWNINWMQFDKAQASGGSSSGGSSGGSTSGGTVTGGTYASPSATVAAASQTLTAGTANLSASYNITGSTLSSVLWSKLLVPGQKKLKIGILGSSTAAGYGPDSFDSSFASRLLAYYKNAGVIDSVVNLAQSGFNPYQGMPTGYKPSASVTAKLSPSDTPAVNYNVTAMLRHKPDVVIVCFPTNGFDVLTIQESMLPLQTIYNTLVSNGIQCYVTTSQPRTDDAFSAAATQQFLQVIRDSVMNRFGTHAINFYDPVTTPGTTQTMPAYAYGDGIHLNSDAHRVLFNVILGANIFQNLITSPAVIAAPNAQNTTVSSLPNGVNKFQISVRDAHGQVANAVTTLTVSGSGTTTVTASAGSSQTITLPTSSVTLNGSGSTGATSYAWTKVSGPTGGTIVSPSAANTNVTGLIQGTYVFQLSVNSGASTSQVTITVNASVVSTPIAASAGGSQTISLPASSVTLDGSGSTGAITSYAWTKVSGPSGGTIVSPSSVSTSVTGLVQGTYVFKLSVNGGTSTSQVTVTVNAATVVSGGPCKGSRYVIAPDPVDSSVWITENNSSYKPGDTLLLTKAYSAIDIQGLHGTATCPIVIMNQSAQVLVTKRINLDGCTYVKLTGSGGSSQYGIFIQQDAHLRQQSYYGIQINDKSKSIEVERVSMHNVDIGIVAETNEDCDQSLDYPNWVLDSLNIHDNKIVGTWNEGMYIGNTSPDNASYDLRPVVCNGVTYYYAPMKNGYAHIWNNIVDSTGRGGIQVANAAYGISEINNNTVSHSGMNGDDAQGSAITLGLYTRAYVHDNTIHNTYTWGIASIGAGATNVPLRIENNNIDSSGYLVTYNLATTDRTVYDPRTEPTVANTLTWPQAIEIDTRPRLYTTDSPHPGTAVKGQDSTQFYIIGNTIGKKKNSIAINVDDDYSGLQKNGNIVCGNKNAGTGTAATVNVVSGISYSTNCSGTTTAATETHTLSAFSADSTFATDDKAATFALSPNPTHDLATLTMNNEHTGVMIVQLIDPAGSIRQTIKVQKDQSYSQVSLPMSGLPGGLYFVRVQVGNWIKTVKLLKL